MPMHCPPHPALARIRTDAGVEFFVVAEQGLRNLSGRALVTDDNIHSLLESGQLAELLQAEADRQPDMALDEVAQYEPLLLSPEKIFCIGVNYANRNAEYKDGQEAPANPSVFMRTAASFVGHGQDLLRPPESDQLDYEGEIVMVVGKGGRRIPEAQAEGHIAGLTLGNEGTIRDWVRHAKFNVTQGKNFERSGSIGPWLVASSHFGNYGELPIRTTVNGEVRQDDATDCLLFPFAKIISYLSTFTTLRAGDVIFTGTPTGAGARFEPPKYLRPGDLVEVHSAPIGSLRNQVADEV